jgi:hypothetical protein
VAAWRSDALNSHQNFEVGKDAAPPASAGMFARIRLLEVKFRRVRLWIAVGASSLRAPLRPKEENPMARRSQAVKFTLTAAKRAAAIPAAMKCDLEIGPDGEFIFRTSKKGSATAVPKDGRSNPKNYSNRHDLQKSTV